MEAVVSLGLHKEEQAEGSTEVDPDSTEPLPLTVNGPTFDKTVVPVGTVNGRTKASGSTE